MAQRITANETITNRLTLGSSATLYNNTNQLTLPTGPTTLVGTNTTDTLTNKTISSATNTVGANQVLTSTATFTPISVTGSAPTNGQVLTYTGANIQWSSGQNAITTAVTQTTNATPQTLETISTTTGMYMVQTTIMATDDTSTSTITKAGFVFTGLFYNDGTTLSQINSTDILQFTGNLTWDANFVVSGANITSQVIGEAATTIDWKSVTETSVFLSPYTS
ncbi:MAG: hypothetical protein ACXWE7_11820 [Nitrososphaeraceae archaeon]